MFMRIADKCFCFFTNNFFSIASCLNDGLHYCLYSLNYVVALDQSKQVFLGFCNTQEGNTVIEHTLKIAVINFPFISLTFH